MQKELSRKIIIGRLEKIDFPDLGIYQLDAKIDTGAYTSSLHCHKIDFDQNEGQRWVRFFVLDPAHPEYEHTSYNVPVYKIKKIRSSNGVLEQRVIIRQKAFFFGKKRTVELSLRDRSEMKYPVLIGRKFLTGRFIVDVSKKYLYKPGN